MLNLKETINKHEGKIKAVVLGVNILTGSVSSVLTSYEEDKNIPKGMAAFFYGCSYVFLCVYSGLKNHTTLEEDILLKRKGSIIYVPLWDGKTPSPLGEHFSIIG